MIACLLTLLATQQDSQLRFTFSQEKPLKFDVRRSFKEIEGDYETAYLETWTVTTQELLNGGAAVLKFERTLRSMEVDGKVVKLTPSTQTDTEKRSPRGDVRDRKPTNQLDPLFELRLRRIGDVNYPPQRVGSNQTWKVEAAATEDGFPAATWVWNFETVEHGKVEGIFTFEEQGIENPIKAEGNFTFDATDGWPIEMVYKAINTYLLGDEEKIPTLYTFSIKRK